MKHSFLARLLSIVLLLGVLCVPLAGIADFGDFGDTGSDSGDSGSWDSDWDSDDRSSKGSSVSDEFFNGIGCILLCCFVIGCIRSSRAQKKGAEYRHIYYAMPETHQLPGWFDAERAKLELKILYCDMQTCWESEDLEPLRDRFTTEAWNRFNTQLQAKKNNQEIGHTRDIVFSDVIITGIDQMEGKEQMHVRLVVDLNLWNTRSYNASAITSPKHRVQIIYNWTLERMTTTDSTPAFRTSCPSCGHELDVKSFAACPFCGKKLVPTSQWLLANIESLSQMEQKNSKPVTAPWETAETLRAELEAYDKEPPSDSFFPIGH